MTSLVDKSYFDKLSKRDPDEICQRTPCKYNDVNKSYTLSAWGNEYAIYPHESRIDFLGKKNSSPHELFYLVVIFYLLNIKEIRIRNEWISEKDIPGGPTFFRGPHEIPTNLISRLYKNNIQEFRTRCIQMGGSELDLADASYSFNIVPQIPVAVLYWEGDDDFPPEAKLLYDRSIIDLLSPDIIFSLAVEVCVRIGKSL
ncbi:MAG: DUF3786 domain-containing protein [Desulfobacteraceae bacterium]|nr:DUF3786 domain-containing protein [Desulfobacteraceae bacterium]